MSINRHTRRHDGRVQPKPTVPIKLIHTDPALEPPILWNDWTDYRDGMRDWFSDKTKLKKIGFLRSMRTYWNDKQNDCVKFNKKLKLLLRRRKQMKYHHGEAK